MSHTPTRPRLALSSLAIIMALGATTSPAMAKPFIPNAFCNDAYPEAITCLNTAPTCDYCHKTTEPVAMNAYGQAVADAMAAYVSPPFTADKNTDFLNNLPQALADIEANDSDGDGIDNLAEINQGSFPGNKSSIPIEPVCPEDTSELYYKLCEYDYRFAYRRIGLDFCGAAPSYDEMQALAALSDKDKMEMLHAKLSACIDSEFWLGKNGVLWNVAHRKIRPVQSLRLFGKYEWDYDYFAYTQLDGHDVREVLTGQYLVTTQLVDDGKGGKKTVYTRDDNLVPPTPEPLVPVPPQTQIARRAGMLTMAWPLFYFTMFTGLPRGAAAQAYRAYLGFDIAQSQGLNAVPGEPVDFDAMGVAEPACATCHATLDPLAYPFSRYNGLQGAWYTYDPDRLTNYFAPQNPNMANIPEAGVIFDQTVADLLEWAEVAANSDQFFRATTSDYYKFLVGEPPSVAKTDQYAEFTSLWQSLKKHHSVEQMLHELIETEAYGAP